MEKNDVDLIKKLKVLTEYYILRTKLMTMNELEAYKTSISKEDMLELSKEDNILYMNGEDLSESDEVYLGAVDDEKRFRQIVSLLFTDTLAGYPEKDNIIGEIVQSRYVAMSVSYHDDLYERICDRLNEIKDKYGDAFLATGSISDEASNSTVHMLAANHLKEAK